MQSFALKLLKYISAPDLQRTFHVHAYTNWVLLNVAIPPVPFLCRSQWCCGSVATMQHISVHNLDEYVWWTLLLLLQWLMGEGLDGWWQMWAKRHGAAGDWRQGCRRLALNRWKNWWKIRLTFKPHKDCTCKAIGLLGWETGLIRWTFGLCRYSLNGSFSGSGISTQLFSRLQWTLKNNA